jgi:hypothetical protein
MPPSVDELSKKHFEDSISVAATVHKPDEMAPISDISMRELKMHHIHNEAKEHLKPEFAQKSFLQDL